MSTKREYTFISETELRNRGINLSEESGGTSKTIEDKLMDKIEKRSLRLLEENQSLEIPRDEKTKYVKDENGNFVLDENGEKIKTTYSVNRPVDWKYSVGDSGSGVVECEFKPMYLMTRLKLNRNGKTLKTKFNEYEKMIDYMNMFGWCIMNKKDVEYCGYDYEYIMEQVNELDEKNRKKKENN